MSDCETIVDPGRLEEDHVQGVYDEIAPKWNETRRNPWALAKKWILARGEHEVVAEIGCGNGRNLTAVPRDRHIETAASDISLPLLHFAPGERVRCCATRLAYRDGSFDATMCIAVVHHMATPERRAAALQELLRVTVSGGSVLLYVRSSESRELIHQGVRPIPDMPPEDVTIDWRRTSGPPLARYHHLFPLDELTLLLEDLPAEILSVTAEKDNWVAVMKKH